MLHTCENSGLGAEMPEPPAKPCQKPPARVFAAREWIGVALALAVAVLWFSMFSFEALLRGGPSLPGIGITVLVFACFAALAAMLGRSACITPSRIVLLVAIGVLALVPAVFANGFLRMANCFILLGLCVVAYFLLSGFGARTWCRLTTVIEAVGFFTASLFRHVTKPFKALRSLPFRGRGEFKGVVIGLVAAGALLVVIVPLLASADVVFRGYLSSFAAWFQGISSLEGAWKAARAFLAFPFLFSLLLAAYLQEGNRFGPLSGPPVFPGADAGAACVSGGPGAAGGIGCADGAGGADGGGGQGADDGWGAEDAVAASRGVGQGAAALPFATALVIVDAVFVVFVAVQFAYLFGGAGGLEISGGYAQYARSGFFELVAVAFINLALVLAAVRFAPAVRALKVVLVAAELVLVGCTFVTLVSAYWRMGLYIGEFGLSLLRALTLLGMAFVAVCLAAAVLKVFKEDFSFFRVFFVAALGLWIAFNYLNIDARIAEYNVGGYLAGSIERIDVGYLAGLSPDALPALERLAAHKPSYADEVANWKAAYRGSAEIAPWYKWCYSYGRLGSDSS
ncbi:MAG: DUF4173 domain-containing protein [Eggerthellaceae bacterium]|nr:DUF4173 domain-containing protein [Eggerthellaceae bacterium]